MTVMKKETINFIPDDQLLLIDKYGILLMERDDKKEEIKTLGYVDEQEFLSQLPSVVNTPVLPKNCVYYAEKSDRIIVGIVSEPHISLLDIKDTGRKYQVMLPYLLWKFQLRNIQCKYVTSNTNVYALKEWPTENSEVFIPPLPNAEPYDFHICFGSVYKEFDQTNLSKLCHDIINTVLTSKYSMHYSWKSTLTLDQWQEKTKNGEKPSEIFNALLAQHSRIRTIKDALQ